MDVLTRGCQLPPGFSAAVGGSNLEKPDFEPINVHQCSRKSLMSRTRKTGDFFRMSSPRWPENTRQRVIFERRLFSTSSGGLIAVLISIRSSPRPPVTKEIERSPESRICFKPSLPHPCHH